MVVRRQISSFLVPPNGCMALSELYVSSSVKENHMITIKIP